MSSKSRILVIDDEEDACELLATSLRADGAEVVATTSTRQAFDHLASHDFDAVLTDLDMKEEGGLSVCRRIGEIQVNLPVILVTGLGSMHAAIEAIRAGAYDLITKPVDPKLLAISVARAVEHKRVRGELARLRHEADGSVNPDGLLGRSRAMQRIYADIGRIAPSDATVLIEGETGVGKELAARRIHEMSRAKDGPFVAVNCAAVPATLLESELFGHARGAFTDASTERVGLFVQANRGTLFLDEIGELPLELQPKLLRALQQRAVRPVGDNSEVPFDARIIAASNRTLQKEVEEKRFREDLYYRINVVRIVLPSLRDRDGDVLGLAVHFLAQHAARKGSTTLRLSPEVAGRLKEYHWPGNVRELENCIAHAVAFARFDELTVEDLPERIRAYAPKPFVVTSGVETEIVTLEEHGRRYIQQVLALFSGNKSGTARALGIDRRTLDRHLGKSVDKDRDSES